MPKKSAADQPRADAAPENTYRATLKAGDTHLATITISAASDEDAREQLDRSKPSYFDGVGEWELTATETRVVQ